MNRLHYFVAAASVLAVAGSFLAAAPPPGSKLPSMYPPDGQPPGSKQTKPAKPPAASAPTATSQPAAATPGKRIEVPPADAKWLEHLPKDDRVALDELLGWAPPPFASDLEWLGGEEPTWDNLRGKVVVIQSFTTGNTAARNWPTRVAASLKAIDAKDLRIIALHTPEDAAGAKDILAKKPAPEGVLVALDSKGEFCDALTIYKRPLNIVVDRNGAVHFAALNANGLEEAVKTLVAEPFQPNLVVAQRPSSDGADSASPSDASTPKVDFPPFNGKVETAMDIRGKRAPEFHVAEWMNGDAPNATGKVVVVDFWATWCGPCVASIPHMNDLASKYHDDVVCVGISDEKKSDFEKGMKTLNEKSKITLESFKYSVALDPTKAMYSAINVRGIPTCLVMDRNWIVRWEGHPATLDSTTLEQIIRADKAGAGGPGATDNKPAKPGAAGGAGVKRKKWTSG